MAEGNDGTGVLFHSSDLLASKIKLELYHVRGLEGQMTPSFGNTLRMVNSWLNQLMILLIPPPLDQDLQFQGQWIWKLDMLPKIVHFLWLCLHNSVPVKEVLAARGISCDGRCPLCKDHVETISHLLKECVDA